MTPNYSFSLIKAATH